METQTAGDGLEVKAHIILDVVTAELKVVIDKDAVRYEDHVTYKWGFQDADPKTHYINDGTFSKVIVGGIHTHPQSEDKTSHGPSTPGNAATKYVDTKGSMERKANEYVLDKDLYKATSKGEVKKLDKEKTDVAKDAIKTYGAEKR